MFPTWFFRQIPWNPKKSQEKSLLHRGFLRKSTRNMVHVSPPAGLCCSSERPLERSAGSSHSAGLGSWGTEWVDFNGFYLCELNKLKLISDWTYCFFTYLNLSMVFTYKSIFSSIHEKITYGFICVHLNGLGWWTSKLSTETMRNYIYIVDGRNCFIHVYTFIHINLHMTYVSPI